MAKTMAELQASIEAKLQADTDFQTSIADLPDEEKTAKISEKTQSELDSEISRLADEAEAKIKAEEVAKNQKIRAEKAEADLKKSKISTTSTDSGEKTLSPKDTVAMINAKVDTEDFDEVVRVSKVLGKDIPSTLQDNLMKNILNDRAEKRNTARATNTGGGNRGVTRETDADIARRASKGEIPEDDEGIARLAEAHHNLTVGKTAKK